MNATPSDLGEEVRVSVHSNNQTQVTINNQVMVINELSHSSGYFRAQQSTK